MNDSILKCVSCEQLGVTCGGPDFYLLQAEELISWCKLRKGFLRLSNAKIAEAANLPRGTIDNLFANTHPDFRYETIRPVLQVLISKTSVQGCVAPTDAETARMKAEIERLQSEKAHLQTELDHMQIELEHEQKQAEQHIGYLRSQLQSMQVLVRTRKRLIYFLLGFLLAVLCAIIAVLIYDKTHPGIGYLS